MERILSSRTVELIREYQDRIGLQFPVESESRADAALMLLQFFTDLEGSLSMDEDEGKAMGEQLLKDVSDAVDELNIDSDEFIDFEKLEKQISN